MKNIYIFTVLTALLMASSCIKEEQGTEVSEGTGLLKVRLSVPEIEVKAASTPTFYAYVPSEVQVGTLNPIAESVLDKDDGARYYSLPSDATEAVFTTLHGASGENVDISADEDGNVWYTVDTEANSGSYFIADEILAGYVGNVTVGSTEPKDVAIKRLTSKITTNFRVKDSNGTDLYLYNIISSVKVEYSGLGNSASVLKDGSVMSSGSYNEAITLNRKNDYLYTLDKGFIPSQEIPSVTVTITRQSGITQTYTKPLGKKLDPNRHYTVNLNVTNINTGGSFIVNDPEVTVSQPISPIVTEKEFFSVTNELTIGGEAGNELMIDVATILPYDWTFELDEAAAEYFSAEVVDGGIKLMAKEGNMGDIRFGNVTLKSQTGGYTKVLNIRQMSAIKHEIIMTYTGTYSAGYIIISGENITVQDPNDSEPRVFKTANSTQVRIDGLSAGKVLTIKGDIISDFLAITNRTDSYQSSMSHVEHNGYYYNLNYGSEDYYTFEFKNCRYLETLVACPRNDALDFSQMPDLKKVALGNSLFSSITFAEGQGIDTFVAYKCNNVSQLDLRNISNTLTSIKLNDCDGLLGANFKNFKSLKHVNVNGCNKMAKIDLTGCTSLESFSLGDNSAASLNVTDCTSLKNLSWSTSLEDLIHDGADAIEYVDGGYVSDFNFSGKTSLKQINGLGANNFDVSGCTNLESMGHIYDVKTLNVSGCSSLKTLDIDFVNSSAETYSFDDCPNIETAYFNNMGTLCDFSPLENLKTIHFNDLTSSALSTVDLTANTLLEEVKFDGYDRYIALNEILLPNSVKTIDIYYLYNLRKLDLSNHTNLKTVKIEDCYNLYDMDFSGCTQLETLALYDVTYNAKTSNNIRVYGSLNLSGCESLEYINKYGTDRHTDLEYLRDLNVDGCSSLNHVNLYGASIQTLDFSDCPKLIYLDVRNNDMTKEEIDAMFISLPDWSIDDGFTTGGYMISGNASGYNDYDKATANAKNWWSIE